VVIRRAREDPIRGAVNRRARLGRARVEAVERGGKSVDPVDPSSGGWFREQVVAPEDDEPELGRRLPWLLTAPSRGWCGSGKPRTSAASRGNPASRARSRVYVDMWGGAGPPPERRAVTAGVLGRHSTEARRGVVSQPVTATRANRWMTSRARRRATSAPYRYRGCLRSCSAREELRSSLREQVSHLCLPSGTGGCGSSPPRRPCAGSNMAEAQKRNAAVELVSSGPEARRELPRTTLQPSRSRRRSRPQAAQRRSIACRRGADCHP